MVARKALKTFFCISIECSRFEKSLQRSGNGKLNFSNLPRWLRCCATEHKVCQLKTWLQQLLLTEKKKKKMLAYWDFSHSNSVKKTRLGIEHIAALFLSCILKCPRCAVAMGISAHGSMIAMGWIWLNCCCCGFSPCCHGLNSHFSPILNAKRGFSSC